MQDRSGIRVRRVIPEPRPGPGDLGDFPAEHARHQLEPADLGYEARVNEMAIPQDRNPVTHPEDLFQAV